jgi:hypothetical protein
VINCSPYARARAYSSQGKAPVQIVVEPEQELPFVIVGGAMGERVSTDERSPCHVKSKTVSCHRARWAPSNGAVGSRNIGLSQRSETRSA